MVIWTHARIAGHHRLHRSAREAHSGPTARRRPCRQPVSAAHRGTAPIERQQQKGPAFAPHWKTHLHRPRGRPVARFAFDDRGPPSLAPAWRQSFPPSRPRRIRFPHRLASVDRSRLSKARLSPCRLGRSRASRVGSWWHRSFRIRCVDFCRCPSLREPHAEARPHRSAPLQRHRQCLFRRNPV